MKKTDIKKGDTVTLLGGYGYWDVTYYPVGGSFHRAPSDGLMLTVSELRKGVDDLAATDKAGRKIVCRTCYLDGYEYPE